MFLSFVWWIEYNSICGGAPQRENKMHHGNQLKTLSRIVWRMDCFQTPPHTIEEAHAIISRILEADDCGLGAFTHSEDEWQNHEDGTCCADCMVIVNDSEAWTIDGDADLHGVHGEATYCHDCYTTSTDGE